jgi:hypothetical protein
MKNPENKRPTTPAGPNGVRPQRTAGREQTARVLPQGIQAESRNPEDDDGREGEEKREGAQRTVTR